MRYQQLRAARETLDHAITYLVNNPKQLTILIKKVDQSAVLLLREALHEVRAELKHPERFNLDGSRRVIKVRGCTNFHGDIHPITSFNGEYI